MARGGRQSRRGRGGRGGNGTLAAATTTTRPPATPQLQGRPERAPVVRDVSAGGIVYRDAENGGGYEIALVGRIHPRRWALPKGTPVPGESLEATALREVNEETGLEVRIIEPLDEIQYWFVWAGVRHFKKVHFYLMEMTGGDPANHDHEYDVVEWVSLAEALRRLSYPNEARVAEKAQEVLGHRTPASAPPPTAQA
jgi:8-oxo-dGTP pyrophosphatase MutT (NUDIX family)